MLSDDVTARRAQIEEDFHHLFYDDYENTWTQTRWMGVPVLKCPFDLWTYQEILVETRPDVVIETGTAHGGSALWFAHMLDLLGGGDILTIDVAGHESFPDRPAHDRLNYVHGSSVDPVIVELVRAYLHSHGYHRPLIVLDSDHRAAHVRRELEVWAPFVPVGGYLIVEDGNVNGHPVALEHGPGPTEAVHDFLHVDTDLSMGWEIDTSREKFHLTFNPSGYLRRLR